MKIQLFFCLLLVLCCHTSLFRTTHFIFGIQLKCAYSENPFKYNIKIWEADLTGDDQVTDGYQGEGLDGDFIYIRGKQNNGDGGDNHYELYAEIFHTCTRDGSSRFVKKRKLGDALTAFGLVYLEIVLMLTDAGELTEDFTWQ